VALTGAGSIVTLVVAAILFQAATQTVNVLNQIRLFAVDPAARSRLNTALVTGNFIGGAAGSALAGVLWRRGGWPTLMGAGAVFVGMALLMWLVQKSFQK
jgi:predicted MFS family arabinose efflux permease